jgi:hypothetical protein
MFDAPYGGALPQNAQGGGPQGIMQMLAAMFKNMGGGQGPNGFMRPMPQQMPQQPQAPQQNPMMSGINQVMDPNKGFMGGLLGALKPSQSQPQIGAPISNSPSTNMQNNGTPSFNNMPWQRQ